MQKIGHPLFECPISGNLYQIYTYMKNKDIDATGQVAELLLYAKTDGTMILSLSGIESA
ncbi:hypothetical protein [Desulfitobacterium sp. AusDCA]|uniref:hypothetical protein n=1 Tax=Desulfitobacterium sp. AusDCA TaxID=3240383 RepID=UPI003DA7A3BA